MRPRVNRWLDFIDRVAWTFIVTFPAMLSADALLNADASWQMKLLAPALASLFTSLKVVAAQNVGDNALGAGVPGNVIEPPPTG
jgi:hypothetical protein